MAEEGYGRCQDTVLATLIGAGSQEEKDMKLVMSVVEKYGVKTDWFTKDTHQRIFSGAQKAWKEHQTLDLYFIFENCKNDQDTLDEIERLAGEPSLSYHIEEYVKDLAELHVYTQAYRLLAETMKTLQPGKIGVALETVGKAINELQNRVADTSGGLKRISDFMERSVAIKEKLHEERFVKHNWKYMDGLPWPWDSLNRCYTGIKKGLHIVAALASQGKSTLAADLSVFWNEEGVKHGIICLDMPADQYIDRYPCIMEQVSLSKLNFGGSERDLDKFRKGFGRAAKLNNVWISEAYDAKEIEYLCYRGVKTLGWKAVIIDYIQLVTSENDGKLVEYTRVQRVTQAIKNIAKRLEIPIVCLAQLTRGFEKELREDANAEPGLDVIGDSGEIARAASTVLVLYQDRTVAEYWKENPPRMLAYADPNDALTRYVPSLVRTETEQQKKERREGQLSLAASLRPVICKVLKNQQGGKMTIPLVMFPSYFIFRPGNEQAAPATIEVNGKEKKCNYPMFEQITDDWMYLDKDWVLEATGAMPTRGVRMMGETYAQWGERLLEDRRKHTGIKQIVNHELVVYSKEDQEKKEEKEDGDQEPADELDF